MNLAHVRALVTRPIPYGQSLADAIKCAGGQAWSIPMLNIEPLTETQQLTNCLLQLDQFNKIIFISRFAAKFGMGLIEKYRLPFPVHCQWFAMGAGTAVELSFFNINAQFSEQILDSESLLNLKPFHSIKDEKILIVKGIGGREVLEVQLANAGANVYKLEVYKRLCPVYQRNVVVKELENNAINAILCGSGETVINLGHYLPLSYRADYKLFVPSERVIRHAHSLGFQQVINTFGASNDMMLLALEANLKPHP